MAFDNGPFGDQTGGDTGTAGTANTQNQSESTLLGRGQGNGAGLTEEITLGSGLTMTGTVLSAASGLGNTSLGIANRTTTTLDVTSDTGADATVPAATTSLAGLLTGADKTKLDAITGTNTGNQTAATVPFTPAGNIAATDVQAALQELDTEKASTTYADAKVADAINDGTTTVAPSQNAVFDALATKQPLDTLLTQLAALDTTGKFGWVFGVDNADAATLILPQNLYQVVVKSGATYTTVADAVDAGFTNILIGGNVTETRDVLLVSSIQLAQSPGTTWNLGDYVVRWVGNNINFDGSLLGTVSWAATTTKKLFTTQLYTFTADITNGSAVLTNVSINTSQLRVGQNVASANIPSNSTIVSIDSPTQITISANALATETATCSQSSDNNVCRFLAPLQLDLQSVTANNCKIASGFNSFTTNTCFMFLPNQSGIGFDTGTALIHNAFGPVAFVSLLGSNPDSCWTSVGDADSLLFIGLFSTTTQVVNTTGSVKKIIFLDLFTPGTTFKAGVGKFLGEFSSYSGTSALDLTITANNARVTNIQSPTGTLDVNSRTDVTISHSRVNSVVNAPASTRYIDVKTSTDTNSVIRNVDVYAPGFTAPTDALTPTVLAGTETLTAVEEAADSRPIIWTAADQTARLALSSARAGDVAVQKNTTPYSLYQLNALPASTSGNWSQIGSTATSGGASIFDATVGPSGADYTTVRAAVVAGKRKILLLGSTTETADISVNSPLFIQQGSETAQINLDDFRFIISASNTDIVLQGLGDPAINQMLYWAPTAAKDMFVTSGSPSLVSFSLKGVGIDATGTSATGCRLFNPTQMGALCDDLFYLLPDVASHKIQIANTGHVLRKIRFVGSGTNCGTALHASASGIISDVEILGDFSTSANIIDSTNTLIDLLQINTSGAINVSLNGSVTNVATGFIGLIGKNNTVGVKDTQFQKISVSGQSDVVADAVNDTLTLAAGSGISITTNASTDTITITSTGIGSAYATVQEDGTSLTQRGTLNFGTGIVASDDSGNNRTNVNLSTVSIANGGTGQTTSTAAFGALSPLGTLGDLLTHNGTNNVVLPVGTNGQTLKASAGAVVWGTLGITGGGTNATSQPTSGGATYYDGTKITTAASNAFVNYDGSGHTGIGGAVNTSYALTVTGDTLHNGATLVVGQGDGGTPVAATIRGPAAVGSSVAGANLTIDASNGTGAGGSGDIIIRTAGAVNNPPTILNSATSISTNTNNYTFNYTVPATGTNRAVLINITYSFNVAQASSVTFGGVSATLLATLPNSSANRNEVWYVLAPTSGVNSVNVNMGANFVVMNVTCVTVSNINQSTPFGTVVTTTGFGAAPALTPASAVGDTVFDSVTITNTTGTPGAGQTQQYSTANGTYTQQFSYKTATSPTTSVSWTIGSSQNYSYYAFAAKAVPATGSNPLTERLRVKSTGTVDFASNPTIANANAFDALAPTTTRGDIITRGASGNQRLALGTNGQVLTSNGTDVVWGSAASGGYSTIQNGGTGLTQRSTLNVVTSTGLTAADDSGNSRTQLSIGTVPIANGGTGQTAQTAAFDALSPLTTAGDIIYRNSTNNVRLPIASAGTMLISNGSAPTWGSQTSQTFQFEGGIYSYRPYYLSTLNTYTFALTDRNWKIYANGSGAQTYTIPTNASVAFALGTEIELIRYSSQTLAIACASGVILNGTNATINVQTQFQGVLLTKIGTDTWHAVGNF